MPEPKSKIVADDVEEERRDTGMTLVLIGWLCWIFALLVMFFSPAGIRLGKLGMVEIAIFLGVAGLLLNIAGVRIRRKNERGSA